jgi:predicted PurR-regulated permease PerM
MTLPGMDPDRRTLDSRRWPSMAYIAKATVTVALTLYVLGLARSVLSILILVLMAAVLAIGLDPAVRRLQQMNVRRAFAVMIIFAGFVLLIALFMWLVLPPLVRQMKALANEIPTYAQRLELRDDAIGRYFREHEVAQSLKDFVADLPARIARSFSTILGVAGKVTGALFDVVTVAILMIYFMVSLPSIRNASVMMVPEDGRPRAKRIADQAVTKIGGYVSGNLTTSLICAVITLVALVIFGVPYAVPLAMWAGIADLIPAMGSYLGAIPAVAVAFFQSPLTGILVLAYFIVYQQFENYYLVPKVMQNAVNLSPATVIISTLIGGSLFGFAGALLALPAAATIKVIIYEVWLRERAEEGDVLVKEHLDAELRAEKAAEARTSTRPMLSRIRDAFRRGPGAG